MNRLIQHRIACRVLWAGIVFTSCSAWTQDNKPMIVITPQDVCDYCDTLVDATFDLTGERLYVAARGQNQDGDVYPWLSLWDMTQTNQTQATLLASSKSLVPDAGDFMIMSDPAGQLMGVAGYTMKLWQAKMNNSTLPYLTTLTKDSSQIHTFAFSRKGDKIAVSVDEDNLSIWDTFSLNDTNPLAKAKTSGHAISIQFHPEKPYIVDGLGGGDTEAWDYSQIKKGAPKHLASFQAPGGAFVVSISPDAERVGVSMGRCHCAELWSLADVLKGHTNPIAKMQHDNVVYMINFDKTGRYIVTASGDRTAKLWDSDQIKDGTPALLATMRHECSDVYLILFVPDKNRLLTSSSCEIKLWDTQNTDEEGRAALLNTFRTDGSYQRIKLDPMNIWLLTINSEAAKLWDIAVLQPDPEPETE